MGIFFGWILLSFVVGFIGSGRKIGFLGAFFLSLFLSPLIGLIVTALSKSDSDVDFQKKMLEAQQNNSANQLEKHWQYPVITLDEQLRKLKALRDEGILSESEFEEQKKKLLS